MKLPFMERGGSVAVATDTSSADILTESLFADNYCDTGSPVTQMSLNSLGASLRCTVVHPCRRQKVEDEIQNTCRYRQRFDF